MNPLLRTRSSTWVLSVKKIGSTPIFSEKQDQEPLGDAIPGASSLRTLVRKGAKRVKMRNYELSTHS